MELVKEQQYLTSLIVGNISSEETRNEEYDVTGVSFE